MTFARLMSRRVPVMLLGLSALGAGFGGNILAKRATADDYLPSGSAAPRVGRELVLVYIGSASCAWSNKPGLTEAVRMAKTILADSAARAQRPFSAVGVAKDWVTADAVAHLKKVGRFDELAVGNGWQNAALQRYVWTDIPGPASTPQLLILERTIGAHRDADLEEMPFVSSDERLILRVTGYHEIIRWVQNGAQLPRVVALRR